MIHNICNTNLTLLIFEENHQFSLNWIKQRLMWCLRFRNLDFKICIFVDEGVEAFPVRFTHPPIFTSLAKALFAIIISDTFFIFFKALIFNPSKITKKKKLK
ncbi:hypothetical protein BpHYR1_028690 [Brachionus plicatilis]|uniref:Uncharacterized protein n=1 Tax=Brachionus plicatilis TaxID=10195 RepID=A0A3M7PR05_BRAPC|nr:hypothetical protein BpHYR1_028690 [Brachionus plicatilis]